MLRAPQGLHAFLRAYYHVKSANWRQNHPHALKSWSADELAQMPTYYIMDLAKDMAETVAPETPTPAAIAACKWLTDDELAVYSSEYARTGFQGALQWYRCRTTGRYSGELEVFSGRTIDVPSLFIAGKSDWGPFQRPGDIEAMQGKACTHMLGCHLIDGAGHWVQQEQPEQVIELVLRFMRGQAA
jgi:pimeloyl-ACP methyl ester carboxylesterase